MNCWEFMRCGREEGGRNVDSLGTCPAYPDHGTRCASVVGTFCDLVQAMRARKHTNCIECPFYNSIHFEETTHQRGHQEKGV